MNKININIKRLGKRKIKQVTFEIQNEVTSLQGLITECVKSEVKRYNDKRENIVLLPFLTPAAIDEQSQSGKISVGDIENLEKANQEKSIEVALQGFKDGLFLVFIDEEEMTDLNQPIVLTNETVITFMRMTFLTGTYW